MNKIEFYKETEFKETPIGKIPKDWKVASLEEVSKEIRTGPFGSQLKKSELSQGGVKVYTQENILKRDFSIGNLYISQTRFEKLKSMEVKPRDVLITIRGSTGASAIFPEGAERGIIHTNLAIIRTKEELLPEYLCILINDFPPIKSQIKEFSSATTLGALYAKQIKKIKILLPPVVEQRAIVEVLSVVDLAIQRTDMVIAKTERLKKGLMQMLLTKGIGHKEFKDTEIGKIPKTWQIVKLKEIAEIRGNKIVSSFEKVAFIPMELIPDGEIFVKYEVRNLKDVSSSTYCEAGDLLLAKITPSLENGKQGIVPEDIPNGFALATTEVYPIVCKGIDKLFLFYILKFPKFRKVLEFSMRGTTGRQRVPKEAVENLRIPLPPYEEQEEIADILLKVDEKLEFEKKERARLEIIKQGLMDLLLTGKVRVRVN